MALSIYQNLGAMVAHSYLSSNESRLSTTIERLSSGLRINHAADDPAGLSVSETMRGQIKSLKQASLNAQDGMSFLQTAEGAMEQTSAMLIRMRELAVQAANGTYSANDRMEMQKEIDQLKLEIDRIANNTEFNTNKLINGRAAGLWTTDNNFLSTIIRGPLAAGNYEMTLNVKPGVNQVQKSNILSLNESQIGAQLADIEGVDKPNILKSSSPKGLTATENVPFVVTVTAGLSTLTAADTHIIGRYAQPNSTWNASVGVIASTVSGYFEVEFLNSSVNADEVRVKYRFINAKTGEVSPYLEAARSDYVNLVLPNAAGNAYLMVNTLEGGGIHNGDKLLISVSANVSDVYPSLAPYTRAAPTAIPNIFTSASAAGSYDFNLVPASPASTYNTYFKAITGLTTVTSSVSGNANSVFNSSGTLTVEFTLGATNINITAQITSATSVASMPNIDGVKFSFVDGAGNVFTVTTSLTLGVYSVSSSTIFPSATNRYYYEASFLIGGNMVHYKMPVGTNYDGEPNGSAGSLDIVVGDSMSFTVYMPVLAPKVYESELLEHGGGTIQLNEGPSGVQSSPVIVYGAHELTRVVDSSTGTLNLNIVTVHYAELDSQTGNINLGSIDLTFDDGVGVQLDTAVSTLYAGTTDGKIALEVKGSGEAATSTTKLRSLKAFTNEDGRMLLDITQELTVYGNSRQATVFLEADDTIADLVNKLNKAIVKDLAMGTSTPEVNSKLIQYVTMPNTRSDALDSVHGTLLVQSAIPGKQGELAFTGDSDILDALGLITVRSSINSTSIVDISNAHTGVHIASERVSDDRAYSLIGGAEIKLDARAGIDVSWNNTDLRNEIMFESSVSVSNTKLYMHIVDSRPLLQIGADYGQVMDISIPQLDLEGLGVENLLVVSHELAEKAITSLDVALDRVTKVRASVGAQVSRLQYTTSNLASTSQYLTTSESRIRDLDVAEESTNLAAFQMLTQSGVAMLAQANQIPQYVLQLIQGR
ncbi:flagellin [Deferribacterales bacterium RsTz2092]|nr:hypothetical protein AGMMS49941_04480 [Deferribacterales bacterium]